MEYLPVRRWLDSCTFKACHKVITASCFAYSMKSALDSFFNSFILLFIFSGIEILLNSLLYNSPIAFKLALPGDKIEVSLKITFQPSNLKLFSKVTNDFRKIENLGLCSWKSAKLDTSAVVKCAIRTTSFFTGNRGSLTLPKTFL